MMIRDTQLNWTNNTQEANMTTGNVNRWINMKQVQTLGEHQEPDTPVTPGSNCACHQCGCMKTEWVISWYVWWSNHFCMNCVSSWFQVTALCSLDMKPWCLFEGHRWTLFPSFLPCCVLCASPAALHSVTLWLWFSCRHVGGVSTCRWSSSWSAEFLWLFLICASGKWSERKSRKKSWVSSLCHIHSVFRWWGDSRESSQLHCLCSLDVHLFQICIITAQWAGWRKESIQYVCSFTLNR